MPDEKKPDNPDALKAVAKETKRHVTTDFVVTIKISHPSTSWRVSATFHLIDPALATDPAAVNGPIRKRMDRFLDIMTEL